MTFGTNLSRPVRCGARCLDRVWTAFGRDAEVLLPPSRLRGSRESELLNYLDLQKSVEPRSVRTLRARWRELETEPRTRLNGHEGGNLGYSQAGFLTGHRASSRPYQAMSLSSWRLPAAPAASRY